MQTKLSYKSKKFLLALWPLAMVFTTSVANSGWPKGEDFDLTQMQGVALLYWPTITFAVINTVLAIRFDATKLLKPLGVVKKNPIRDTRATTDELINGELSKIIKKASGQFIGKSFQMVDIKTSIRALCRTPLWEDIYKSKSNTINSYKDVVIEALPYILDKLGVKQDEKL